MSALIDGSAWLMMVPSLLAIYFLDPAMAKTIMQWCLPSIAIAGLAIILSRITFPQVHLDELVDGVKDGNVASAILAAALLGFVGMVMLALMLWAKA